MKKTVSYVSNTLTNCKGANVTWYGKDVHHDEESSSKQCMQQAKLQHGQTFGGCEDPREVRQRWEMIRSFLSLIKILRALCGRRLRMWAKRELGRCAWR